MSADPTISERVAKLYPNQGLRPNGAFIAALHERAIEYLEQAPVLAMSFGWKAQTRADRLYVAMRVGGPISRGERLRNVMASVGIAAPLRKLKGSALYPSHYTTIRELSEIDPSTLSQVIPVKSGDQRKWFQAIGSFNMRAKLRYSEPSKEVRRWLLRQAGIAGITPDQSADFADFIHHNPLAPVERWTWQRAQLEMTLWHDRIAIEEKLPGLIQPNTQIDHSKWPDHSDLCGYEFFKLSTPSMLMEEGRRMRHCVGSYVTDVMNGGSSIFSIRKDMGRIATVQIAKNRIVQIKAFANKRPIKSAEAAALMFIEMHGSAA